MRSQLSRCAVMAVLLSIASFAAGEDNPFVGKWKANPAKSNYGQATYAYAATADGGMQWTADGLTGTFRLDGKEYPEPPTGTAAWKQLDSATWETVHRRDGRLLYTETVYQRTSGDAGLLGTWKTTKVSRSAPITWEVTAAEGGGIASRVLDTGASWTAGFDGKDVPITGPTVAAGFTIAIQKKGPRAYTYVRKHDGKEMSRGTVTVSGDGRTTTIEDTATGTTETTTDVYERQ